MKKYIFALALVFIVNGCQSKKDTEYLSEAESLIKQQKIEDAVKTFEEMIAEYPESPLAPKAVLELAKIYQAGMIKNMPKDESLQMSLSYFKLINEKYPKSTEAPVALFMTGFIEANELQNFDAARKSYEQFMKLYPGHELAVSVEGELSTLGMTPDQILRQKDRIGKK